MNTDNIDTSVLDDLLSRREDLKREATFVDAAIAAERASLIFQKYGVKVGSIVRDPDRNRTYRVTSVTVACWPFKPTLRGNPLKGNGTFSTAEHLVSFGDWELVE